MSEYMEKHAVSKMIGSPPGYIGHDDGGQLTEKIRRRPYSVILFDEIEKAHPDAFNILLQVMEEGKLTDGQGRIVDFRNTIIIMTSNVGAKAIKNQGSLGFGKKTSETTFLEIKKRLKEETEREFRPEFLNRIDEIVVFHPLTEEDIMKIIVLEVNSVANRIKDKEISLVLSMEAKEFLMKHGYDQNYGARPMRRAVQVHIENPLSDYVLAGTIVNRCNINIERLPPEERKDNERLVFKISKNKKRSSGIRNAPVS
jgi:ATP-dependent Clp protease ATP-binding subunit ClpC